ncbi:CocE/NonD family hydrolase [Nocardioides sp. Kera G14]|uniref:CocE/NonD family hydrolase n=1 Tax=Nocardioides sp. Kera G14 TaxID=2884264 RepID=UPI001D11E444|nr:CocE/NonD family hydrolase [Nocardioides sp. Kera G14]UDY24004.1 CocE/NonD family hydrolase [Nocardioides sp. Kera G14]
MTRVTSRTLLAQLLGTLLAFGGLTLASPAAPAHADTWTQPPAQYTKRVTTSDIAIPLSDGTILRGDLTLPADADGTAVPGTWPTVVTLTPYNKSAPLVSSVLGKATGTALVPWGYAALVVDVRGTGSSEGQWCSFCTRENLDGKEVMDWVVHQPWSNGVTGMTGASYMGINQIFTAAQHPQGLKAIFPIVPAADVYRDVVASGGAVDSGFIPFWLGLVTATGIIPPAVTATDPSSGLTALVDHLTDITSFTAPVLTGAMAGSETAYDGDFYAQRSPINVVDQVDVPTFLVGGEYDIFQRGTPLLFENLQSRGVPVKLIDGPWTHIQGATGDGLDAAGLGSLDQLQLRWFDHYLKGIADPGLDAISPITYYEQGTKVWRTAQKWVDPTDTRATVIPLDGTKTVAPLPTQGLCSRSSNQWVAGLPGMAQLFNSPCFDDNRINDAQATTWTTAPLTTALPILGPINAHLNVSSPTGEGMLSVAVSDVAPDGSVTRLTGGWQVISHRALDTSKSRMLDGQIIQPWHPYTLAAQAAAAPNETVPVDVEVFPTGASIQPGHSLRLSVQAYDVPHLLPTLPEIGGLLSPLTIHSTPDDPSVLILPSRDRTSAAETPTTGAPATGTPSTGTPSTPATSTSTSSGSIHTVAVPKAARSAHRTSRTTLRLRGRSLHVRVRGTSTGRVRVYVDGRRVGVRQLKRGRATIRLTRTATGRHTVQVVFVGTSRVRPSTGTLRWLIR